MERAVLTAQDMGWKPNGATFRDCCSLSQVGNLLHDTAKQLAPIVKEALQLWLQAERHLPSQLRAAASVVQSVHGVLQAAQAARSDLAWMQQHLHVAVNAMMDNMRNQEVYLGKLTQVLKALKSEQHHASRCATALVSNATSLLYLRCMGLLYAAGTAAALAATCPSNMHLAAGRVTAPTAVMLLAQHAERQAVFDVMMSHLIITVGNAVGDLHGACKKHYSKDWDGHEDVRDICCAMASLQLKSDTVWLKAALRAPPNRAHDGTVMLRAMDWYDIPSLLESYDISTEIQDDFCHALCCAVSRPDFWNWFSNIENTSTHICLLVICMVQIQPRRLLAAGMPDAAVRYLHREAATARGVHELSQGMCQAVGNYPSSEAACTSEEAGHHISTESAVVACRDAGVSHGGGGGGSQDGTVAVHTSETTNLKAGACDDSLPSGDETGTTEVFDMHALLLLMYGEAGLPAHMLPG